MALLKEGQLDQGALAFCRALGVQAEDAPLAPASQRGQASEQASQQVTEQLGGLLSAANFDSISWWVELAGAWLDAGMSAAGRGCVAHARRLALDGGAATWEDLCRLAELASSEEQRSPGQPDQAVLPMPKAAESHRLKFERLWSHLNTNWDAASPDIENLLSSDPVAAILRVRTMDSLPLNRWIMFWNNHGEPGVAIDHFFAAVMGGRHDQKLFSEEYGFWSLFRVAESFRDTQDPVTAYASLLLLSLSLNSGVALRASAKQVEEWLAMTREQMDELAWVSPNIYSPAATGTNIAVGLQLADWFVANNLPGRFLEFIGEDNVVDVAERYPLLKERLNAMVRKGGWVPQFVPELQEVLEEFSDPYQPDSPLPPEAPVLARDKSKTQRVVRAGSGSWTIRRPRPVLSQPGPDQSIVLNIGLQREAPVRALLVHFGQYNPLALIHARARQVLPKLIGQLVGEGRSVIWIRDAKQDPSPTSAGIKVWSWTRGGGDQVNLLTSLTWSPALQDRIAHLLSSSVHVAFREDIRACLNGLLPLVAKNPAMLEEGAKRHRFLRCVEEIRNTGLSLDGPSDLRRLAVLADSLMSLLDDLRRAAAPETAYYGNGQQPRKLAVFDTEAEGQQNTLSLLLYVGGLLGLLRKRHELDFQLNPRPRTTQPNSEKDEAAAATLEEQRARLKELEELKKRLTREPEEEETPTPSIIDGSVAELCVVVSAAPAGTITSLLDWLSPGSLGAGASLLTALDRFPEAPDFLSEFRTFVLGHLSEQERSTLRTGANVLLPPVADESPAAVLAVSPQDGRVAISSGLLWPPEDRGI